jgi:hypothetical protein
MEIIFTEFIFAYSLAEYHNKVATSIFYFVRTVIHATVQTDRLCYIKSELPKPLFYSCRLETGIQKVGGNIRILGRIRALYSQSDFRGKY